MKSKSAVLQNVTIRLNEWGLRGGPVEPVPPGGRRILFLGGSIALGWGVSRKSNTVEARLQQMLRDSGEQVQVLNGGVGNYNADRYVSRFFKELPASTPPTSSSTTSCATRRICRPAAATSSCATASSASRCGSPTIACSTRRASSRWSITTARPTSLTRRGSS